MVIIMFGAPGVGKGTQSKLLSDKLGISHLSTGEKFREEIENGSEYGMMAKSYIDKGELVPDEITIEFVKDILSDEQYKKGCIFDGFPRTMNQAEILKKILMKMGNDIHKVINLSADDKVIMDRLLNRGRQDDTEEIIKDRLKVYKENTEPLIQYYGNQNLLLDIESSGDGEEVNETILKKL